MRARNPASKDHKGLLPDVEVMVRKLSGGGGHLVDRPAGESGSTILGVGAVSPGDEAGMATWVLGLWTGKAS